MPVMYPYENRDKMGTRIRLAVHTAEVKLLVRPFVWANRQQKQTPLTRVIRAVWRAL